MNKKLKAHFKNSDFFLNYITRFLFPIFLFFLVCFCLIFWTSKCTTYTTYSYVLKKAGSTPYKVPFLKLINHFNKKFVLGANKKKFIFINFIYLNCPHSCPISVIKIRNFYRYCNKKVFKYLDVLSISFDAERDTVEKIYKFWSLQGMLNNWNIAIINESLIDISVKFKLLGVSAKKDRLGEFSHTNFFFLVNKNAEVISVFSPDQDTRNILKLIKEKINNYILEKNS
jgi:cytochrome oxidase Cu insertion factor (SCO1/SenC/PrrC family)